jgi:hypothetical protein
MKNQLDKSFQPLLSEIIFPKNILSSVMTKLTFDNLENDLML